MRALALLAILTVSCGPSSTSGGEHPVLVDIRGGADPETTSQLAEAVRDCYHILETLDPQPWRPVGLVIHEDYWALKAARPLNHPTLQDELSDYSVWRVRGSNPTIHVHRGYKNAPTGLAHGLWHARRRHGNNPTHSEFSAVDTAWRARLQHYWVTR